MKKKFLATLAALLLISSCTLLEDDTENRDSVYNYRINELKSYDTDNNLTSIVSYIYDENNNLCEENHTGYDDGETSYETSIISEYDAENNITKLSYYYSGSDTAKYYQTYEYDDNNDCSIIYYYYFDEDSEDYEDEGYDINNYGNGYCTSIEYFAYGELYTYTILDFDTTGKMIKVTEYESDKTTIAYQYTYEYNTNGDFKKIIESYDGENIEYTYEYVYEYDDANRIIKTTNYTNSEIIDYSITTYEEY